jgi:ABC-type transporter Mla MlaB component
VSAPIVLRIDRSREGEFVVLTLSGHVARAELTGLHSLFTAESAATLIVDLADVIDVDRDGVAWLASLDASGIRLRHCPAYVREWMATDRQG